MNKISKLEQYVTQTHTGKNVVSHYLTKADDDDEEVDLEEMKVDQPNYKVTDTIDVLAKD